MWFSHSAHTQCHTDDRDIDRHARADTHTLYRTRSLCKRMPTVSQRTSHFMRSRHIRPCLRWARSVASNSCLCVCCGACIASSRGVQARAPAGGCTYFAQPLQSLQLLRSQVEARLSPDCAHDASHQKDFFTTSSSETRSFDVASCSLVAFLEEAAAEEAGHESLPPTVLVAVVVLHA